VGEAPSRLRIITTFMKLSDQSRCSGHYEGPKREALIAIVRGSVRLPMSSPAFQLESRSTNEKRK
jgi:hypothetical protein